MPYSQIQPIVHLEYQSPVLVLHEWISEVVVTINEKKITHRFVSPLQPAVDVEIIPLIVVLQKSGPEKIVREIHFYSWSNQEEIVLAIGLREL